MTRAEISKRAAERSAYRNGLEAFARALTRYSDHDRSIVVVFSRSEPGVSYRYDLARCECTCPAFGNGHRHCWHRDEALRFDAAQRGATVGRVA
jgi:hypothetical protein